MNKCKKCDNQVVIITDSEIMQKKEAKDFWCPTCQKYFEKEGIKIEPDYVTLCPYCGEYLAESEYPYCCHCGKKLKKPLIKETL